MNKVVVGIDIGGTNSEVGLVDKNGNVLDRASMSTRKHGDDFDAYLKDLSDIINQLATKNNVQINGVGIGAPNGNIHTGSIENAPNLDWEGNVPLCDKLRIHFPGVPIKLTNDANAAALGEKLFGKGKDIDDFVTITLGTGVGSGFIVKGELMYGHDGMAGEAGHTVVDPNGRKCACGRRGCLETYVSASGIVRTAAELLSIHHFKSKLAEIPFNELQSKHIAQIAEEGDEVAKEVFEVTGRTLGMKLADIVAISSPKAIFIAGGVVKAGELLLKPVRENLEANLLNIYKGKVTVETSGLPGIDSAILGAAALVV
ncbi:MAG: glucokinase [Salinivirgaceae bacterium]|nr:MAG: glucokinase [Salinivirgaceae bacterium]